jgi:hypothetical protein
MDTVRHNSDARLGELERALWELQSQLERAETTLQKRIAQTAIEHVRRAYHAIPQGGAFEARESARPAARAWGRAEKSSRRPRAFP